MIEYRDVVGFPGYEVSSDGRLWSRRVHGTICGPRREIGRRCTCSGYLRTSMYKGSRGTRVNKLIHNLVCEAFYGPRPGPLRKWNACHKNGDRLDNRVCNLYWATASQNSCDKVDHGTLANGERNGRVKISEELAKEIKHSTRRVREWVKITGLHRDTIRKIRQGKLWKHI